MIICKLNEIAKERNLTVLELEKLTGISNPTLYRLCGGYARQYRRKTIDTLCKTLNISVSDLFEFVDDTETK